MSERHFGKELARRAGIDLEKLNAEVRKMNAKEVAERPHIDLSKYGKKLVYIKNKLERYHDFKHFLNQKTGESDNLFDEKLASYELIGILESNLIWIWPYLILKIFLTMKKNLKHT